MSAAPLTECPQCKGSLIRIIGTGSGPIFKGSGFYHTDYKGKSQQSKKNNESENKPLSTDKKADKDVKK
jgi:predicted nucleic acid-binding Zn ribbon protein